MTELIPPLSSFAVSPFVIKVLECVWYFIMASVAERSLCSGRPHDRATLSPTNSKILQQKTKKKDAIWINRLNCTEAKMKMAKEAVVMDSELVYWALISKCMKEYLCNITSIIFFLFLTAMLRLVLLCIYCLRI